KKQVSFIDRRAIERRFPIDQSGDEPRVVRFRPATGVRERRDETTAVVVAQIFSSVILIAQRDPFFGQKRAQQFKVQRLVVNYDAIKIEYDRSQFGKYFLPFGYLIRSSIIIRIRICNSLASLGTWSPRLKTQRLKAAS